jgi:hypothetical protein
MSSLTLQESEQIKAAREKSSFKEFGEYMANEYKRREAAIKKADEAFLNSILSYAVYAQNSWMFTNLNSDFSDMGTELSDAIKNKDKMYALKVWHFMKNTFEKIPDHELGIPAERNFKNRYKYRTHYYFKDGQFSADNGLAYASILKSKNAKGDGHILHLTFRGTEFSRLNEYIKGPYLDMSAYYQHFRAMEIYIRDYVNNPANKITEIHVSGHSLGGAMVQEFLKHNSPEDFNVPIKGFTFGSPGSEKKWYHKFVTVAYHTLGRGLSINNINSSSGLKLDNMNDNRINQYYHSSDPVPLVGLLGYMKGKNNYSLADIAYKDDKDANLEKPSFLEKTPAFGKIITYFKESILNKFNTKFHDSKRYIINLRNYMEQHYNDPEFGSVFALKHSTNWQNWRKHEKIFSTFSIKYKSAFEYLIKQGNPELDQDKITKEVLEIRERMRCDSQANVILSKFRNTNGSYDYDTRFFTSKQNLEYIGNVGLVNKHFKLEDSFTGMNTANQLNGEKNPLDIDSSLERIKRMRKLYEEKMEVRAAIFKKPS